MPTPMPTPKSMSAPSLVTFYVFAAWFAAMVLLGRAGVFVAPPDGYPLPLLGAITLPVFIYLGERRLGHGPFAGLRQLSLAALVALQTFRIGGLFFLVEWARGSLPAGFALPAGIGDLVIGASAPFVAARVAAARGDWRRTLVVWNTAGLVDLAIAVGSGVLHAQSPLGVLAGQPPSDLVAQYPLHLVPTFLVPVAIVLHLSVFVRLRARTALAAAPAPRQQPARA